MLKSGGSLFFCEDKGFRALLDGSSENIDSISGISEAFASRITIQHASPWRPDLSASDASLLSEVLTPFGGTKPSVTFIGTRAIDTGAEPECYLPWNPERIDVASSLVHRIKASLAKLKCVKEEITLYEFRKSKDDTPFDLLNLGNPRTRLAWRAIGDRAARVLGELLISWQELNPRASDLPFRKAVLFLLYQNLFRHFGLWKTVELIVGALSPEFTLTSPSQKEVISDYQSTCVEPADHPRFWSARDRKGQYLKDYENNLIQLGVGWVGEQLYKLSEGGVYCWTQEDHIPEQPESWLLVSSDAKLRWEFKKRETPDCIYTESSIWRTDRLSSRRIP